MNETTTTTRMAGEAFGLCCARPDEMVCERCGHFPASCREYIGTETMAERVAWVPRGARVCRVCARGSWVSHSTPFARPVAA